MIFNSVTYLIFLAVTVTLYWVLPRRPRLWMMLIASLMFYAFWRWEFTFVMVGSALTDFIVGLKMGDETDERRRKFLLGISLTVNLGLLAYFKYLLFFVDNFVAVLHVFGSEIRAPILNITLPLGISFYTFQTISYSVDVYRRVIKPERDLVLYGCFVTDFFHQVAGPILRAREVLHQLDLRAPFSYGHLTVGFRRILYGLFLKVGLADNISPLVDAGFEQSVASLSALDVWTLAFLFGFQIYFDFAGYSHIALGSARMMGIQFPENFNFPYMARSAREFWRRWHISLSSWIRDYLYLPLMGARYRDESTGGLEQVSADPKRHPTFALFATWAIMGFWHGANWTFVLWGVYHATFVWSHRKLQPVIERLPSIARNLGGWALTLPIAMLGWIPFRAKTIGDTFGMYAKIVQPHEYTWMGLRENTYLVTALLLLGMSVTYFIWTRADRLFARRPMLTAAMQTGALVIVLVTVFVFLRPISQFIYFQF